MKKVNLLSALGGVVFMLGIGLNLQYALDDYGLGRHSLSPFVLAQTNSTGGTNSSSGGSLYNEPKRKDCVMKFSADAVVRGTIFGCEVLKAKGNGELVVTVVGGQVDCEKGGNFLCTYRDCYQIWNAARTGND